MFITGDIHGMMDAEGRFDELNFPERSQLTRDDYLIICGDFGMPYQGDFGNDPYLADLAAKPWTTLFVDGNHENFEYLSQLPEMYFHGGLAHRFEDYPGIYHLMRGQVYDFDGTRVFIMGGAFSFVAIDTYDPRELPDAWDYEDAERNLEKAGWKVDYVITHDCAMRMLPAALGRGAGSGTIVKSELNDWFERLEGRLDYKIWYFGHHMDDSSMFAALADLSAADAACSCKILLQAPEEKMHLGICAIDIVNADIEMKHAGFSSDAAFREWVRDALGHADTVVAVPENADSIKAFVTCSYNYWSSERTIVYAL